MAVNLAYFKDVIFSACTLVNFGGMWKVSNDLLQSETTNEGVKPYALNTRTWLSGMLFLNAAFLLMTLFRYWRHAFYLKHWEYQRRLVKAR